MEASFQSTAEQVCTTLPHSFEASVARQPERCALRAQGSALSYRQLDQAANGVAQVIIERIGHGAEPVALLLGSTMLQTLAILGVLKASRAYLPLDPQHPAGHRERLLRDARPRLLLTERARAAEARELRGAWQVVVIEGLPASPTAPARQQLPESPAAILYTSGSTGIPKGVVHSHHSILHAAWGWVHHLRIDARDRLLLSHAYTVGASLPWSFAALLAGAAVLPLDVRATGLAGLADYLRLEQVTILLCFTAVFRHFASALPEGASFPRLRIVRIGGDAVLPADISLFRSRMPRGVRLINTLGTTETLAVASLAIDHDTILPAERVPVGFCVHGCSVRLLDAEGRDAACGEIVVEGRHLASGYWQRPELSAAAFQRVPEQPGVRRYRTGDAGRMSAEGLLTHLGRLDAQLKVRGFRVELAAVEAALASHTGVRTCAVVGREEDGDVSLVAFVVARRDPPPAARVLAEHLRTRLPSYMLPRDYVSLPELPCLPGGKVDRRALAAAAPVRPAQPAERAVSEPDELALAGIFARVLGRADVPPEADFFALGGDSLRALRLLAALEQQLGLTVSLTDFAARPTLAELLGRLHEPAPASPAALVALQARGHRTPLFLMPAGHGHTAFARGLAQCLGQDQPVYGLQSRGLNGDEEPLASIEASAAHFCAAMRRLQPRGPYRLGGYCMGALVALEVACQLQDAGEQVSHLVIFSTDAFWKRATGLRDQLELHRREIAGRSLREVGRYLRARLAFRRRRLTCRAAFLLRPFYRLAGRRLPLELRYAAVAEYNYRASWRYRPRRFAGRVCYFQGDADRLRDPRPFWQPLATRGVEVHRVSGELVEMFSPPHVQPLAAALTACLARRAPSAPAPGPPPPS